MADYNTLRTRHAAQYHTLLNDHLARITSSADQVHAKRERRLRELISAAKDRSPWHRKRLAHLDPDRVTEADLPSIPPMTKGDLMTNFDGILTDRRLSRDTVEEHLERLEGNPYLLDTYRVVASGGSSGMRGVFVYDWDGWLTILLTFSRWRARAQLADPVVGLRPVRAVIAATKASHISYALAQTLGPGSGVINLPATLPVPDIVARLNELQPTVLQGYPSMIATLAREADIGRLRIAPSLIATISEPLLPEMRAAIEAAWKCPVLNNYGASEGASAGSCGLGRGMHLNEDLCMFEPVDKEGHPVPAGQRAAKLYVTPLFNHAQPLIRYELSDEVTLIDEPCPCGSALRRIDDIEGRADDIFVYDGGVTVHPLSFRSPLGRERHVLEYQVRQTERGAAITLRVVGEVRTAPLCQAIERELERHGLLEPVVTIDVVDIFARQPTGKLKRFFSLPAQA